MNCPVCKKPLRFEQRRASDHYGREVEVIVFGCLDDIRHCKGIIEDPLFLPLFCEEKSGRISARSEEEICYDWWSYYSVKGRPVPVAEAVPPEAQAEPVLGKLKVKQKK